MCEEEQPADKNNDDTASNTSNLPRWQQQMMTRPHGSSPVSGTLTRTTSSISTSSDQAVSAQESSLHQWQSPGNGSDDLFETGHNTNHDNLPAANDENLQDSSIPNHPDFKGLSLPVLSQDIFQLNSKGNKRLLYELFPGPWNTTVKRAVKRKWDCNERRLG